MQKITYLVLLITLFSVQSHATKCGEFIYNKYGMIQKYEWAPNSISENSKKNGSASSTSHVSTEGSTAISDPGVTTGRVMGFTQSFSSYGECSFWTGLKNTFGGKSAYIEENLDGIKKQAALGEGGAHMESLLLLSDCSSGASTRLGSLLQKNYAKVCGFHTGEGKAMSAYIDDLLRTDSELRASCADFARI